MFQVSKTFTFSASHQLTDQKGSPCENLHGHNYSLTVTVEGELGADGLVINFDDIKKIVHERVLSKVDHSHLNNLLSNPSAELIAKWVFEQIKDLPRGKLVEVKVCENPNSCAIYKVSGTGV